MTKHTVKLELHLDDTTGAALIPTLEKLLSVLPHGTIHAYTIDGPLPEITQ